MDRAVILSRLDDQYSREILDAHLCVITHKTNILPAVKVFPLLRPIYEKISATHRSVIEDLCKAVVDASGTSDDPNGSNNLDHVAEQNSKRLDELCVYSSSSSDDDCDAGATEEKKTTEPLVVLEQNVQKLDELGVYSSSDDVVIGLSRSVKPLLPLSSTDDGIHIDEIMRDILAKYPGFERYTKRRYAVVRNDKGWYDCQFADCGLRFKFRSHLIRHLQVHLDVRFFQCTICYKDFKRKDTLKRHKLSHKKKLTLFKCAECGKDFKRHCSLVQHKNNIHSNRKLFKCNVCEKEYASNKNLKYHLNTHARVAVFKCEQCDDKFYNPWTKCRHKQKEHTE